MVHPRTPAGTKRPVARSPRLARLACVLLVSAAALVPAPAATEVTRIKAQGLPLPSATGTVADAQRTVLQRFLQDHPDIEIEPFAMPVIEGIGQDSTILMAIAAGVAPQAVYVNFRQSSTFIERGFLVPLEILLARLLSENPLVRETDERGAWRADPTAAEIAAALEAIRARVPAPAWPVVYRVDPTSDSKEKHVWTLPTSNLVSALLYRRDLFFAAGLDPDRAPATWDELLAHARELTVPERRQFGISLTVGPFTSASLYPFLASTGTRAITEGADGQWRASYDTPEAAGAMRFAWELIRGPFERNGTVVRGAAYTAADAERLWTRGQIGMRIASLEDELIASINPQLVGLAPLPASPQGIRAGIINARMMGVFSQATPVQQLAVMRYLWFLTGDEAREIRTRIMVAGGMGQFVNPDLLRRFGYESILRTVPEGWSETFRLAMDEGVPEPYGSNTQSLYRHMSTPMNEILEWPLDTISPAEGLERIRQRLAASVGEVNLRIMGDIPPETMAWRRIIGGAMLALVIVSFVWCLTHVWRHFSKTEVRIRTADRNRLALYGYGLVTPALLLVFMWDYLPLLGGLLISLADFQIVKSSVFVGVDNFANVVFDGDFWMGVLRTLYFVALSLGLGFWPPIVLAILLSEVPTNTAKYFYRTVFYLPAVISGVVVMFLWRQLYDPSEYGILNQILMSLNGLGPLPATVLKLFLTTAWLSFVALFFYVPWKMVEIGKPLRVAILAGGLLLAAVTILPVWEAFRGVSGPFGATAGPTGLAGLLGFFSGLVGPFAIEPLRWIQSPDLAMLCVVIPAVWAGSGPGCLLYLAALKTVPEELYEAAEIDGASHLHKIFYIIVPRLKFLIVLQFIAAVTGAFKGGTESIMIMTGGGPNGATTIAALEIFFRAFLELDFGMAAAMAWIIGVVLIVLTSIQLKMLSRAEFKAAR